MTSVSESGLHGVVRCRPRPTDTGPETVALASGLGGLADALVSNAPRVIKTRAQLQLQTPKLGIATALHGLPLYGVVSSFGNLWCFTVQHLIKSQLGAAGQSLAGAVAGGLAAGISESLVTSPARKILVRHAIAQPPQSMRQVAQALWQTEGLGGLWRGAPMAAARNGVAWGSFFATLHVLRGERKDQSTARNVLDSAVACAVACLVGTPLDTVVTHMQSQVCPMGLRATTRQIAGTRGLGGFYAGTGARLGQALPSATVSFFVMTQALALLQHIATQTGSRTDGFCRVETAV